MDATLTTPSKDPRVASAIAHWAPRFVSNGVPLTDFEEVTAGIERWEQWCRAWSARAAVHEEIGRKALADGCKLSAGEHLTRAAVCYHFAKFVFVEDQDQMRAAHMKAVECRQLALPHLRPAGEYVRIPFEGKSFAGILRRPADEPSLSRGGREARRSLLPVAHLPKAGLGMRESGGARPAASLSAGRPPVVVMCMGLDSAKEEMESYEALFLARGIATLAFDGPGQGESEYDFAIRGDYESAVKAVIDWLEARADVDAARAGLWGVSLGGYYAPRAAAFEPRVKACIGLSGPYDFGAIWNILPELTREAFRVRGKCATQEAARKHASTLTLRGVAAGIKCPLYLVAGKQDRLIPWQDAARLAREASGPVELVAIEDGNHVANNRVYKYRAQSADWMAQQLGLPPV